MTPPEEIFFRDVGIKHKAIAEKNLFGRGQSVTGNFSLGSKRQDYLLHYNEPYFNDSKMSLSFDAFNTTREYTDYTQKQLGFGVGNSYPFREIPSPFIRDAKKDKAVGSDELAIARAPDIWDYMRGGVSYAFTKENISGVKAGASPAIQDEKTGSHGVAFARMRILPQQPAHPGRIRLVGK